jgi:Zn finger protein HypA/HybF involved in hydrogenase expression
MNKLTREQARLIARLVEQTRPEEFNCEECQYYISELAERHLYRRGIDDLMSKVEHHLTLCPQCREEFTALEQAIRS